MTLEELRIELLDARMNIESAIRGVSELIWDRDAEKTVDIPTEDGYYLSNEGYVYRLERGTWSDGWGNPLFPGEFDFPFTRLIEQKEEK